MSYLDFIYIKNTNNISSNQIKELLLEKQNIDFMKAMKDIDSTLEGFDLQNPPQCDMTTQIDWEWIKCKDKCYDMVLMYMKRELESTYYMLKILQASILTIVPNLENNIIISITDTSKLNGKWENDKIYINIIQIADGSISSPRLIMGFGPSSSGKTWWALNVIKLFCEASIDFPKTFLTVDGGIFRDMSSIYKLTRESVLKICKGGYTNLVVAGFMNIFSSSLFNSDNIKKNMMEFLLQQSKKIPISLYIPETLGDCGRLSSFEKILTYNLITDMRVKSCESKITPYIEITGDTKWIGLLIWQHKEGKDCDMSDGYKCTGCTDNGKLREQIDGKKYSNSVWEHSMLLGNRKMLKAPGGSYKIHNSGGKLGNISTIEDFTDYTKVPITIKNRMIQNSLGNKYRYLYSFEPKEINLPKHYICNLLPICF